MQWTYDDFGNRLTQTGWPSGTVPTSSLAFDQTTNQITTSGYTYDAGGNLTSFQNPALSGTPTTSIAYDILDRVTTVTTGGTSKAMKYDAFGRRVQTLSGTQGRAYFYSTSGQLL